MKRVLLGLVLLAACGDPTIPDRQDRYAFDDGFGAVFRWPASHLPVRYYADERGPMDRLVTLAIATWEPSLLYGEWRAVLVADSGDADVIVRWGGTVPPDIDPAPGVTTVQCQGLTQIQLDSTDTIERPIRITVEEYAGTLPNDALVACYARVVAHELGHSIGLLQHSAVSGADLMSAQPILRVPSARDRATVEVLYHTPPTIGVPPR